MAIDWAAVAKSPATPTQKQPGSIDWSAVAHPGAAPKPTKPAPSDRGAFSPLQAIAKIGMAHVDAAKKVGAGSLDLGFKALDLLGRPGLATQALLSGEGNLNDFTRARRAFMHGLSPADADANRRKILSQLPSPIHPGLTVQQTIDASPPWAQAVQNAVADTLLDPTTALGGGGALEKIANIAGKSAIYGTVKGGNAALGLATRAATSTPALKVAKVLRGAEVDPADVERAMKGVGKVAAAGFDNLTPRGRLTRKTIEAAPFVANKPISSIAAPFRDVDAASTIRNQAINTQRGITAAGQHAYDAATKGLSHDEQATMFRLIQGAKPNELPNAIRPEVFTAAETVANLYRGILHLQGARTVRKDLAAAGFAVPDVFKEFDTSIRGIFNRSNVRTPYLPHGGRFSAADKAEIRGDARPGLTEEDLLGSGSTRNVKQPGTMTDAADPAKKHRLDTSHLQDVNRQTEINRARFATAGRSIAGRDASRALAERFAPAVPVMRKVAGDKADVGEVYRAAVSGLNPEQKRIVNLLQQGATPEVVAARVGVETIPKNLVQRAQTVLDAANYVPEARQVATGAVRHDFAQVPRHIQESFLRDPAPSRAAIPTFFRGVRSIANLPKYGFFFNPLPHMVNIATFGTLADPRATATAAARFAAAHPEFSGSVAGAGIGGYQDGPEGAAVGALAGLGGGRLLRHATPVTEAALGSEQRAIDAARKAGAIPFNPERQTPGLIRAIPGISQLYEHSNRTLWRWDEALKAARYDSLIKAGVNPATAAQRVGQDLIDYGGRSGVSNVVSFGAQFPSYRVKMPGAILRATARHPERVLAADRFAPALTGHDQDAGFGDGSTVRSYVPLADTFRGLNAPQEYLRSTLSYPARDVLSGLGAGNLAPWEKPPLRTTRASADYDRHYYTYGQPVNRDTLATEGLGSIPGGDEALTALNLNPFTKGQAPYRGIGDAANAVLYDQIQASLRARIRKGHFAAPSAPAGGLDWNAVRQPSPIDWSKVPRQ